MEKISSSGGWFTSAREWNWSGQTYTIKHSHRGWTATTSDGTEVARFSPYKLHLLNSSEHGSLQISPYIQDEHERVFIIVVMIYSATKRQQARFLLHTSCRAQELTKEETEEEAGGARSSSVKS
ncbi:hypothetical protein B0H10DRAFT_1376197 [Mycena sp. CBHHK59/15]|nr:hypothetical protein B0H10DRAFT_1376197 [Mycena sp. CBHHK59/15]